MCVTLNSLEEIFKQIISMYIQKNNPGLTYAIVI